MELTPEQKKAYDQYVRARTKVGLGGKRNPAPWVPFSDVLGSLKPDGEHHPLFIPNALWTEYVEAFEEWLRIEPPSRKDDRMRMSRGDYGKGDSWEDHEPRVSDVYTEIKGKK